MDTEEPNPEREKADEKHLKAIRALKSRMPDEWARQIKKLTIPYLPMPAFGVTEDHVRAQCACIVWWDFFGGRPVPDRWPHLDKYLNKPYIRLPREVMIEGLVLLGYPQRWAEARIKETYYSKKHT